MSNDRSTMCPSVPPEHPDAVAFGVIGGTVESPELIPLIPPQPVNDELLALAGPVNPGEVFRFAGKCAEGACSHWENESHTCRLALKTVQFMPRISDKLKACAIRPTCRWYGQEGKAACERCPGVVSSDPVRSDAGNLAAATDYD